MLSEFTVELTSDFRRFYDISIYAVGQQVTHREALLLVEGLKTISESLYCAAFNGWKSTFHAAYPVLADIYEAIQASAGVKNSKIARHPRPWNVTKSIQSKFGRGKAMVMSAEKLSKILSNKNVRLLEGDDSEGRAQKH